MSITIKKNLQKSKNILAVFGFTYFIR